MIDFIRFHSDINKQDALRSACSNLRNGLQEPRHFAVSDQAFDPIPGKPFAYWVSKAIRETFTRMPPFESDGRKVRVGLQTSDDFRFVRAWWEPKSELPALPRWFPFAKGGGHSPYYCDLSLVVNWSDDGLEMKAWADPLYGNSGWSRIIKSTDLYFKPGITWPLRAKRFSPQSLPKGSIFSVRGYSAFPLAGEKTHTLAIFNSAAFDYIFKTALGRFGYPEFIVGILQAMPRAEPSKMQADTLRALARKAWSLKRDLDTTEETSHAFILPMLLRSRLGGYDPNLIEKNLAQVQSNVDAISFELYGFSDADRADALREVGTISESTDGKEDILDSDTDDDDTDAPVDQTDGLLSWTVGVAFGRFDWRLAGGERSPPPEPEPFDELPERCPGMLPEGAERFYKHVGFLVDDPGHPHDLAKLVEDVLVRVDVSVSSDVRAWLQRDFFDFHLKRYSKSKRKAPIYWQIATASGRYNIWLYAPSANAETFFRLQQDVLEPKIANEERALSELSQGGRELSSRDRLEIENQEKLVEELKQLADEVKRVAPLWNPILDDGTVLVMAPLWRMVGHHKQWQKELRTRWEELQSGKCDWSHQAMHLWPERVVHKCAEDRSLAIAHDLEDVFWFEAESGKWAKRDVPTRPVNEIVRERTSDAVKAALKELLEAPEPAATGSRSRRRA